MSYELCEKARALQPYDPVQGVYRIRLDANESFLLPTETDREAMATAVAELDLRRYPDPLATAPVQAFAALYGVKPSLVTAGNGSDELIGVIMSSLLQKGETVLTVAPDFSMYHFYTSISENPCITLQKREDLTIDTDAVIETIRRENVRLFIFSNPCNPTSLGLSRDEVRRILKETEALIVLDEAYMDFWDQSLLPEVEEYDNLIILRTASKALGMAALRLGFAVANETITAILRAAKSPYNVNAATQAIATIALSNPLYKDVYIDLLIESRKQLYQGCLRLLEKGYIRRVYDSVTNFVLVEVEDAPYFRDELADFGIIVRCFGNDRLRITAGKESENKEVLAGLASIAQHRKEEAEGTL
ncbi:MAG: histidinol-phosphate aminotransferase family protein [Clostridia bacterium]|nr:histidinol-phosphate aminotransferase family protein [Clostridia bacterium]